jgi:hypothetical protein
MFVLTVLWTLPVLLVLPAAAGQTPRITSDTAEYCGRLAARHAASPAASREPSRSLAAQGVELCGNGHVRTGIAKLRRALRAARANMPAGASDQCRGAGGFTGPTREAPCAD